MRNLLNIVKALHKNKNFTANGIADLINWVGNEDLCLEILMGDYEQPELSMFKVDQRGIVWNFLDYNPLTNEVKATSNQSLVFAKDLDSFLQNKTQNYSRDSWFGFYKVGEFKGTWTKTSWEDLEDFDYTYHGKLDNSLYSPAQQSYLGDCAWMEEDERGMVFYEEK